MSIFSKRNKVVESPPDAIIYGGTGLTFGQLIQNNSAMNISAVYRAVEIISDSVAMLPLQVKKDNIILENHRVYEVFKSKNINKYLFIKMLVQSVLLKGNGFAYIERDGDGTVKSLRFLESCDVSILYNKQTNELYYNAPIIGAKRIEPCNMLHFKKNSYDGITGISVLSYANRAIKNANNTENSANNFFESGCNLSGVLKVEGQLSPQQKNDIRQSWATAYSAGGNGLAVLQGNMTYQPIQISATDAQLIESREFNVEDIGRFFGITPGLLGVTKSTDIEKEQEMFLLHTLQSYIVMVEEELTKKLLKTSEKDLYVNLDETYLLKTHKAATAEYFSTLVKNGIISCNEARTALGYEVVDGGDDLVVPYTKIEDNIINQKSENDG